MVPMQVCALKHDVGNDTEHRQRDALLDDLQLDEVEGSSILDEAEPIRRHLAAVFEEGDAPREYDDPDEWPMVADPVLLKFQMPIPSQCHKDIA